MQEPTEGVNSTTVPELRAKMAKILPKFCTRERFILYFNNEVADKGGVFTDEEIDVILNELDPYITGVLQINVVQRFYADEIRFNQQVNLNRP